MTTLMFPYHDAVYDKPDQKKKDVRCSICYRMYAINVYVGDGNPRCGYCIANRREIIKSTTSLLGKPRNGVIVDADEKLQPELEGISDEQSLRS